MGEAFVFYVVLILTTLSQRACTGIVPPHDDLVRCAESCLKLISHNSTSTTDHDDHNPQMVKHCAKLTPDGKCECDWEKIISNAGVCECRNPLKTIDTNNQCVCDYAKCKPPMKNCKIIAHANDENCTCPAYQCRVGEDEMNGDDDDDEDEDEDDVCPEGSYRSNQTQDGGCVCYPCKSVTCKEGQNAVVVRKGTNKPGTCCDLYQCDDLYTKKTCEKDGHHYVDGESWIQDECTIFRCENGIIFQELKGNCVTTHPCFFKDLVYAHGSSWFEDECTNCTCINGKKKCMAHFCKDSPAVTIPPKAECPYMGGCRKKCAFGYRLNRQGCEICKCRQPDAKTIQDILRAVNCTPESCDLIHLLPSNCSSWKNISAGDCAKTTDQLSSILSVFLVIISCVCIFLIVVIVCLCRQSHGQKRLPASSTASEYVPFKSKWDANSNTEKPVLCKNVESNSYGF